MTNRLTANAVRQLIRYQARVRQIKINHINKKNKMNKLVGVAKKKALLTPGVRKPGIQPLTKKSTAGYAAKADFAAGGSNPASAGSIKKNKTKGPSETAHGAKHSTATAVNKNGNSKTGVKRSKATETVTLKTSPRTAKPTSKVLEMRKMNARKKVGAGVNKTKGQLSVIAAHGAKTENTGAAANAGKRENRDGSG